jgi:hypothetical protein
MSALFVHHRVYKYVGSVIEKTRIKQRFENQDDAEERRVQLPSGKIRIAAEINLRHIDRAEYNHVNLSTASSGRGDIGSHSGGDGWLLEHLTRP